MHKKSTKTHRRLAKGRQLAVEKIKAATGQLPVSQKHVALVSQLVSLGLVASPSRKITSVFASKILNGLVSDRSAKAFEVRSSPTRRSDGRASAEFLKTYEWRVLRYKVLAAYGPKCMCCGATPHDGAVINVDHIKPRRRYPELALTFDNLQVLCSVCNHGKSNWDETDHRPRERGKVLRLIQSDELNEDEMNEFRNQVDSLNT